MDNITDTSPYLTEADLSVLRSAEANLYKQLVVKRNRKMAQQIEGLLELERNKTFFLGLGAGQYSYGALFPGPLYGTTERV